MEACANPEGFAKEYAQAGIVYEKWRGPRKVPTFWGEGGTIWRVE